MAVRIHLAFVLVIAIAFFVSSISSADVYDNVSAKAPLSNDGVFGDQDGLFGEDLTEVEDDSSALSPNGAPAPSPVEGDSETDLEGEVVSENLGRKLLQSDEGVFGDQDGLFGEDLVEDDSSALSPNGAPAPSPVDGDSETDLEGGVVSENLGRKLLQSNDDGDFGDQDGLFGEDIVEDDSSALSPNGAPAPSPVDGDGETDLEGEMVSENLGRKLLQSDEGAFGDQDGLFGEDIVEDESSALSPNGAPAPSPVDGDSETDLEGEVVSENLGRRLLQSDDGAFGDQDGLFGEDIVEDDSSSLSPNGAPAPSPVEGDGETALEEGVVPENLGRRILKSTGGFTFCLFRYTC